MVDFVPPPLPPNVNNQVTHVYLAEAALGVRGA